TDAQLSLADNLLKQGELKEAAAACQAAIEISPDAASTHLKLAEIRAKQKRYDDCLQEIESTRKLAPYTHPSKVLLAVYRFQNGEADQARELLAQAHAEMPDHPVPELFLGQFAMQNQRWDEARRHLDAAATRAIPDNWPDSHKKRFLVLLHSERFKLSKQLHDINLARDSVVEWLKYEPDNHELRMIYENMQSANAPL
ncbi:MAG: tetratricopeptide repeat protein, partial [Planctomycetes bacterium]|nr:tetratricopeptide repeat protein [Planctomycetota bacterium]